MSSGTGASGGKTTGSAKKVIAFALAIFVIMMIAPNIDTFMAAAESMGSAVSSLVNAIGAVFHEIATAFQSASGGA